MVLQCPWKPLDVHCTSWGLIISTCISFICRLAITMELGGRWRSWACSRRGGLRLLRGGERDVLRTGFTGNCRRTRENGGTGDSALEYPARCGDYSKIYISLFLVCAVTSGCFFMSAASFISDYYPTSCPDLLVDDSGRIDILCIAQQVVG